MLGKILRSLRESREYTQKDLATMIGLTPKMISFYEKEQRQPPIDVDPALLQELSAWKKMQAEEELRLGPSYRCNYVDAEHHLASGSKGISRPPGQRVDLVCTKRNGAFISPDIIRWRIRQEGYNSHSFRHTHATLLIEHGASAKGVAGRLGHASTLLTQDLYTHNTAKLQKDTEKIFEQTLQPEMQTKQKCRQNADK